MISRWKKATKHQLRPYSIATWMFFLWDNLRFLKRIFNRYPLADHTNSLSCRPLFIVGSGRSGTTLLRSMLVAGGQIAIPPETQIIRTAVRRYISLQYLGWADLCRLVIALFESHRLFPLWEINLYPAYQAAINIPKSERCLARVIDQVFLCYADQRFPDATTWGDQSPINTFYWPWIARTFPKARYLHLLRDGRDAIASLSERGLSLEKATQRWIASVEECSMLQSRLDPDQFLEVRYEMLVSTPVEVLKQVCAFTNVVYNAQMLDFWKLPTTIEHKHQDYHHNLGKPIFTSSIGSWKERLSPTEQKYVLVRASNWLKRLGYLE